MSKTRKYLMNRFTLAYQKSVKHLWEGKSFISISRWSKLWTVTSWETSYAKTLPNTEAWSSHFWCILLQVWTFGEIEPVCGKGWEGWVKQRWQGCAITLPALLKISPEVNIVWGFNDLCHYADFWLELVSATEHPLQGTHTHVAPREKLELWSP